MTTTAVHITDEQKQQYRDEGYFILERAIPEKHLTYLRDECQRFIDLADAEMDRRGVTNDGISHKGSRYFLGNTHLQSEKIREFVFSDLMADICRATLGDDAFVFLDQYVVKGAEKGLPFGWHQDSGYVGYPHPTYLTCWSPLDDVSEENGTVYLLPYSRIGSREVTKHIKDEATNDMVGYFGDDPGIPVIVPAGSVAVFGSNVFHRSGPNRTEKMRRVMLTQYTKSPLMKEDGDGYWGLATPFLKNGERVTE